MSIPRPEHPRMQFYRPDWVNLNGEWSYEFDFGKSGIERGLQNSTGFAGKITVPFCPESPLSGVGHTDFIESMFYQRVLEIPAAWNGRRILLHFGAVDYTAVIYLDGVEVGRHSGGSISFTVDLTRHVEAGKSYNLVVHVLDNQRGFAQTFGKQSPKFRSYGCSYTRVTGIWQTVWLEAAGMQGLKKCRIVPEFDRGAFGFLPEYFEERPGNTLTVRILAEGREVVAETVPASAWGPFSVMVPEPRAWSPEDPFLYTIVFEVKNASGELLDRVESYGGLRKIHVEGDRLFLNNKPLFLRMVLDQGYYPDGIWTAPSDEALVRDIELSMAAGFNSARLHQKVFEERFHYHADRMGYLTWGESASWGMGWTNLRWWYTQDRYAGVFNFLREWRETVERDANHPSIIAWTPLNETDRPMDLDFYRGVMTEVYDLTKQVDPTRPVNDASGYQHVKTDLWTVHLYRKDAAELKEALTPAGGGVWHNSPELEVPYAGQPYLNDEFGGFMYIPPERAKFAANTWGYHGLDLKSPEELCAKIAEQVDYMLTVPNLSGYCYTQLTDVEQEQNGLYNYDRTAKVPEGMLKAIFGKSPEWAK